MECRSQVAAPAMSSLVPGHISSTSLAAAFAQVPDPRRQANIAYPLAVILALAVAALLANHRSVLAIAEWGARQSPARLAQLGFPTARTPCQSTPQRLFAKLDGHALSATLSTYFASDAVSAGAGVAIDGKAQRGRLQYASGGAQCTL